MSQGELFEVDFWTFILILIVGSPIAKAVAQRIARGSAPDTSAIRKALEQTEEKLEMTQRQLEDTTDRLLEVEERLDFAERLLAQQNRDGLPP